MKLQLNIYSIFSLIMIVFSLVMFLFSFLMILNNYSYIIEWEIFFLNSSMMEVSFIFDWMSMVFLGVVMLISGSIMNYSVYYMEGEKNFLRFVFVMIMFVGSMGVLIISPNLVSLLLGWDGLGFSSYVLVVFYQNEKSCNAGMITILSNRIGDVAILISIGLMFYKGSWSFYVMDNLDSNFLIFLVLLAGMTKSAQIPFSAWLPAAMAAPTPVSALVHSSTLVTAGVYLLIRFFPVYSSSVFCLSVLLLISICTMFMAGFSANFEMDMKKVVALSTLSQLGLMMMSISLGMWKLAFFHLITHAMFKSTLFMCVGFMIHSSMGAQDMRFMGVYSKMSPLLMGVFSVTNMALAGVPFLAGFYSKDLILEEAFGSGFNFMILMIIILGTGFTVSYSLRVLFFASVNINNGSSVGIMEDINYLVYKSMSLLYMGSIFTGVLFSWLFCIDKGYVCLENFSKYLILMVSFMFGVVMFMLIKEKFLKSVIMVSFKWMFGMMWYLPYLSVYFLKFVYNFINKMEKIFDKGWLEYYGGKGGEVLFMNISSELQKSQITVMIMSYLMVYFSILMIFILFLF